MIIFWFYINFKNGHLSLICQCILHKLDDFADEKALSTFNPTQKFIFTS